jgi:hypothetical protein
MRDQGEVHAEQRIPLPDPSRRLICRVNRSREQRYSRILKSAACRLGDLEIQRKWLLIHALMSQSLAPTIQSVKRCEELKLSNSGNPGFEQADLLVSSELDAAVASSQQPLVVVIGYSSNEPRRRCWKRRERFRSQSANN